MPRAGHVAVVDRARQAVVARWPLPVGVSGNYPMALDEADHRLFLGCRQPAKLLVLDTDSGKTVESLDIVGGTDDVFYDRAVRRIYVSGSKGSVSVIQQSDADHYSARWPTFPPPLAPKPRSSFPPLGVARRDPPPRFAGAPPSSIFSRTLPLVLAQTIPLPQVAGGFNHHSADDKLRRVFLCATTNRTVEGARPRPAARSSVACREKAVRDLLCSRSATSSAAFPCGQTVVFYDAGSFEELGSLAMPCGVDELRYDSPTGRLYAGCMSAPNEGIAID